MNLIFTYIFPGFVNQELAPCHAAFLEQLDASKFSVALA
jgi:hypothetical protein